MKANPLLSESRNPQTMALDTLSTLEMVRCFNQQDALVAQAVEQVLEQVAQAVDVAGQALQAKGRIIYLGAGSSGRLGVLDAVECPPTFGVPAGQVTGLIAGGSEAMFQAKEGAEDDPASAQQDLRHIRLNSKDVLIGIAASGYTPYVMGGLEFARKQGCHTVAICCNANAPVAAIAHIAIVPLVGAEVLTGSTRLKAGTAQKMILNMISTGAMVKCGKVWQNLMVDMKASNNKLLDRACRMVCEVCSVSRDVAIATLEQTHYQVKPAILMLLAKLDARSAQIRLAAHKGFLRNALQEDQPGENHA